MATDEIDSMEASVIKKSHQDTFPCCNISSLLSCVSPGDGTVHTHSDERKSITVG